MGEREVGRREELGETEIDYLLTRPHRVLMGNTRLKCASELLPLMGDATGRRRDTFVAVVARHPRKNWVWRNRPILLPQPGSALNRGEPQTMERKANKTDM